MASSTESRTDTNGTQLHRQKVHLIWLATDIEELRKDHPQSFTRLHNINNSLDTFSDVHLFINFLFENNNEKKIFLIITGAVGKEVVPIIHDAIQLDSIFVFCHNKTFHEQWTKTWPKVKGVFNKIDVMCQTIEQTIQPPEIIPPKSTVVPKKSPPIVPRPTTPEQPRRTTHRERTTAFDDQLREPNDRDRRRRRGRSAAPAPTPVSAAESTDSVRQEPDVKREAWVETKPVIDRRSDAARPRDNSSSPLINSKAIKRTTPETRPELPSASDELERTLIATAEQEVRNSLLVNRNTMDQLQGTILETIKRHVPKEKDDSDALNRLFSDLKQVLVDAIVQQQQQQPVVSQDVIKKTVLDVLNEQKKLGANLTTMKTTTDLKNHRKPITIAPARQVKIMADVKQTRIDAAFRQERDAVVANKRLRDAVQQWSSITSMADLATTIKKHGKNNLEYAWLLFCWIGQNIRYQPHCNNNSAETVFRTRQGVCRGFVSLYHECCSLLNIECLEISGYAKQAFIKSDEELKQSSHAWNSIILDQYTYLIDPTWGAGGRDNENKLEDFYFLTSPEEFIYTHYCTGNQLLQPEISRKDFLGLPVMKSTYYQLGLTLLSPKQGINEINENLFKIAIRTPEHIELFIQLKVNNIEYPRTLHTLCQRDETQTDVYNCYIAPPVIGLYEVAIFAKTHDETHYHDAINMRLRVLNIVDAFTFPYTYTIFTEHNCILIEPLQRLVYQNEEILIHMIIPNANVLKIRNGDDYIVPGKDEYKKSVLRKKVCIQGDIQICARWDDNADSISIICVFNML